MGRSSRDKGRRYETEFKKLLIARGCPVRDLSAGIDCGDLWAKIEGRWTSVEVKYRGKGQRIGKAALDAMLKQAQDDAEGGPWLLAIRRWRQPWHVQGSHVTPQEWR